MNSHIRLEAKALLSHNTCRLFFLSLSSLLLRCLSLLCGGYLVFLILQSTTPVFSQTQASRPLIYFLALLLSAIICLLTLTFVSAIKMGEAFAYFTLANGGNGRFFHLFKFLAPTRSLKAFVFYLFISTRKLLWWLFFLFPAFICAACGYYLYQSSDYSNKIIIILSTCFSVILAIALVMGRICSFRYSAAAYYLCLNPYMKIADAVKKSCRFTDGHLSNGVLLEYSLLGWLLSCVFLFPLIYVIPYTRLVKSVYVTSAVFSGATARTRCPIIMSAYKATP